MHNSNTVLYNIRTICRAKLSFAFSILKPETVFIRNNFHNIPDATKYSTEESLDNDNKNTDIDTDHGCWKRVNINDQPKNTFYRNKYNSKLPLKNHLSVCVC